MTNLDSLDAAGVAWCSEADFASLIAVARAAQKAAERNRLEYGYDAPAWAMRDGSLETALAALEPRAEA